MWKDVLKDLDATLSLGHELGRVADVHTRVFVSGDLGAGKTSLAQGVGTGLSCSAPIVSPTFILLSEYECGRLPFLHGDAYRLRPGEADSIGLLETVDDWPGIVLIEWAERVPDLLESEHLRVQLNHVEQRRQFEIEAVGEHHRTLLERWRERFDR